MRSRYLLITLLALFTVLQASAQKKPLTHDVYDDWKTIQTVAISNDGNWAAYRIAPQVGDAKLEIRNLTNDKVISIDRVSSYRFSNNSQFVAAEVKLAYAEERALKLKKTSASKMPKDSLYVINLSNGEIGKFARVKNYQLPSESDQWMAWVHEKPLKSSKEKEEAEDTSEEEPKEEPVKVVEGRKSKKKKKSKKNKKKEEAAAESEAKTEKKPKWKSKGTELVLYNMATGETKSFKGVMDYEMSKSGNYLFFEQDEANKDNPSGVYAYETATGTLTALNEGLEDYKKLTIDESGEQLAFLATANEKKEDHKFFSLMYWKAGEAAASIVADTTTAGIPDYWKVSENASVRFSDSGKRLYMGTAPRPVEYAYETDTMLLKDDKPDVDVWSYNDPFIQPMQKLQMGREKNRSYRAMIDLDSKNLVQLATPSLEEISIDYEVDLDFYLSIDDKGSRVQMTWDTQRARDIYKVNVKTGRAELLVAGTKGFGGLSPEGKYVMFANPEDGHWYSMNVATKALKNLTKGMKVQFSNELHDSPSLAGSYGSPGWTDNDEALYLYDRYDIWKFDPDGVKAPQIVTKGAGRKNKVIYRYTYLDRDARTIDTSAPVVVSAFNEWTKASGFAKVDLDKGSVPATIVMEDMSINGLIKAKNADRVLVRKSTWREFREVYVANSVNLDGLKKLTNVGAQEEPYKRGTAELVEFKSGYDQEKMQAILYKPENFDPNKKYPMIVYFYERRSDSFHSHGSPAPSASTVNIPYFVSNDYMVLVPDIKYEVGYPGRSAMNHVIPATKAAIAKGGIDESKMAIQGQSWGGYQVAYMVTRTNMYAAAGAGAPVSNMTSAYGGVRWGSGMSRMFQYEKTQTRIGATLWERPDLYIENSPIFKVPEIETPLFLMHNDADGAVPWYQGIEFYMSLRRLQKPAWMVVYNGEAHNLRKRKNRKDLSIRMGQFFDHFLKDAPMPEWMAYGLPATLKNRTLRYDLVNEETEKPKEGERISLEKTSGNEK